MKKPRCETCNWMSEKMNKWDGTAYLGKFNYIEVYRCQIRAPHPKHGFAETTPEGFCGQHSDYSKEQVTVDAGIDMLQRGQREPGDMETKG